MRTTLMRNDVVRIGLDYGRVWYRSKSHLRKVALIILTDNRDIRPARKLSYIHQPKLLEPTAYYPVMVTAGDAQRSASTASTCRAYPSGRERDA